MKNCFLLFLFSLLLAPPLAAQTIPVVLKKSLWPDARGELSIASEGLAFKEANQEKTQTWPYRDIQTLDRQSRTEFVILTYEDQWWKPGGSRQYVFRVTSGELTDELFEQMRDGLAKPVTNRVIGQIPDAEYRVPVKHLHRVGGCQGQLIFTPEAIYYQTEHVEDARAWRLASEVASVWSAQPYQLELQVYEGDDRALGHTRSFNFLLKAKLDSEFYRKLKLTLYDVQTARGQVE